VDLLIVGASARAAAFSALRAGLIPGAIDLFADRDLAAIARCVRVPPAAYPSGLIDAADDFPPCPWIYTGALENRPDLVSLLTRRRPLRGNRAPTLRLVRDPIRLFQALHDARLPAPAVRLVPHGLPRDGSWLRKPLASSGGHGIVPLRDDDPAARFESPSHRRSYYQERISGRPMSAVFVGRGAGAELAGVTLQLTGYPLATFAYRGSLAPGPVSPIAAARISAVGEVLAATFGLVGLFGVDLILQDDTPWPVEVNPRYTASVEVIELATRRALLRAHQAACEGTDPGSLPPADPSGGYVAKEILFSPGDVMFADDAIEFTHHDPMRFEVPDLADLPDRGARFRLGEPVLTVFAQGPTPDETLRSLAAARRLWASRLRPTDDTAGDGSTTSE
jgi:predicted ATP-grasp superfamily ATP-dependent carboligase